MQKTFANLFFLVLALKPVWFFPATQKAEKQPDHDREHDRTPSDSAGTRQNVDPDHAAASPHPIQPPHRPSRRAPVPAPFCWEAGI